MSVFRKSLITAVTFMCCTAPDVQAQQDSAVLEQAEESLADSTKREGYIASYWHNGVRLVSSPLRWKGDEWAKVGGTVIITGLTIIMDDAVTQPFFNWQNSTANKWGKTADFIGNYPFQFGITGAALGIGALAKNKPLINFGLDNLQAQVFVNGAAFVAKHLTHRTRPNATDDPLAWSGPFKGGNNQSFYSNHTSVAFSTATMIFLHSKKKWWVGLLSYGAATGVAVGRMQSHDHWASDVIAGAVMGSAISAFVYRQQEKRRHSGRSKLKPLP